MKKVKVSGVFLFIFLVFSTVYADPVITIHRALTISEETAATYDNCSSEMTAKTVFAWNAPIAFFVEYTGQADLILDVLWYSNGELVLPETKALISPSGCFWRQCTNGGLMLPGPGQIVISYNGDILFTLDFMVDLGCAAERLALTDEAGLNILRGFRDNVLAKSKAGQKLTDLYYESGDQISEVLEENPVLRGMAKSLLNVLIFLIKALD